MDPSLAEVVHRFGQAGAFLVALVEQLGLDLGRHEVRPTDADQPDALARDALGGQQLLGDLADRVSVS